MLTEQQADDIRARHDALRAWMAERNVNSYRPEEVAHLNPPSNVELSALEVFEFKRDRPKRYMLYIDANLNIATTWTGEKLGDVTFGSAWRSSFGDMRVAIRVRGINGVKYHGTYYKTAGDYARIVALTHQ